MNRKCRNCHAGELIPRTEDYHYKESGVPDVTLAGVTIRRCSACMHSEVVVPRMIDLHQAIARAASAPVRLKFIDGVWTPVT